MLQITVLLCFCGKWHFEEDYTGMSVMLEKLAWAFVAKALGPVTHCGSGSPHGASQAIRHSLGKTKTVTDGDCPTAVSQHRLALLKRQKTGSWNRILLLRQIGFEKC